MKFDILEKFNQKQLTQLTEGKKYPEFRAGDTIKVFYKIIEGNNERIQIFQGVCIGRKSRGLSSTFRVRKISNGEGVERIFQLYSPKIDQIEVVRHGKVRRAKLYYMRDLSGKAARIKERMVNRVGADVIPSTNREVEESAVVAAE